MNRQDENISGQDLPGIRGLHGLNASQLVRVVVVGVTFWFAGALAVKTGAPLGMFGPIASLFAFAAALPIGWVGVLIAAKAAQLQSGQIIPGIAVGSAAATFCDGIALTWARSLYGSDPEQVVLGAAWILWGVFAFFAGAILEARRRAPIR